MSIKERPRTKKDVNEKKIETEESVNEWLDNIVIEKEKNVKIKPIEEITTSETIVNQETKEKEITLEGHSTGTGIRVTDNVADIGFAYDADYSTNGAGFGARWIPDKGYNDATYATISGSGNVFFRGTPTIESHTSGSGKIIPY